MQILNSRNVGLLLARIAPIVGGATVLSSFNAVDLNATPAVELWRIITSVSLGIFVTLVGIIYKSLERRVTDIEKQLADRVVPRQEYAQWQQSISQQLDRIERKR